MSNSNTPPPPPQHHSLPESAAASSLAAMAMVATAEWNQQQQQQQHSSSHGSSHDTTNTVVNNATTTTTLPPNESSKKDVSVSHQHPDEDDEEDEYARFVKSIIQGTTSKNSMNNINSNSNSNNHHHPTVSSSSTAANAANAAASLPLPLSSSNNTPNPKGTITTSSTTTITTTTTTSITAAATVLSPSSTSNLSFVLLDDNDNNDNTNYNNNTFYNEDDDEEFQLDEEEDDEEDDDKRMEDGNDNTAAVTATSTPPTTTALSLSNDKDGNDNDNNNNVDDNDDCDEYDDDDDDDLLPEFFEPDFYQDLEEELGSLLEEDLEAAVSTLLGHGSSTTTTNNNTSTMTAAANEDHPKGTTTTTSAGASSVTTTSTTTTAPTGGGVTANTKGLVSQNISSNKSNNNNNPSMITPRASNQTNKKSASAATNNTNTINTTTTNTTTKVPPLSSASSTTTTSPTTPMMMMTPGRAAAAAPTVVSKAQQDHLQRLMAQHYQLLLQQAVLAIRTAHYQKTHRHHSHNSHSNSSGGKQAAVVASQGVDWIPSSGGETSDDLAEILDGAVGMLQDLDENRRDAIRNFMQLESSSSSSSSSLDHAPHGGGGSSFYPSHLVPFDRVRHPTGRRSLLPQLTAAHAQRRKDKQHTIKQAVDEDDDDDGEDDGGDARTECQETIEVKKKGKEDEEPQPSKTTTSTATQPQQKQMVQRRLTRAAFKSSLQQQQQQVLTGRRSSFDIAGLAHLQETFSLLDKCVDGSIPESFNVLQAKSNADACRLLFQHSRAMVVSGPITSNKNYSYIEAWIPGVRDLSEHFCDPREIFGSDFSPPLTAEQQRDVRKNRNLFTSGEDNLVLRGVNLYGEKQWILIADRYLPDRSVNIISQRYSMLCLMLYRAHGIHIEPNGNLEQPPKLESVDDIDDVKVSKLKKVEPPAILNVHRWSLEEDLTLLKAVPLMGHMWAELGARLIPHRDRGHLRKRYQVLERRVKATIARAGKKGGDSRKPPIAKAAAIPMAAASSSTVSAKASHSKPPLPIKAKSPQKSVSTSSLLKRPSPLKIGTPRQKRRRSNGSDDQERDTHHFGASPASSSRGAFERLVNETSADWSQMSRVRRLMENDAENTPDGNSALATNDVPGPSHLEKEVSDTLSRLPQMEIDGASNGLSVFNTANTNHLIDSPQQKAERASSIPASEDVSILASVLQRSKKVGETNKETSNEAIAKDESPSLLTERTAHVAVPSTPSRRPTIFSADGTPIGLSPAFRSGISPFIQGSASKSGIFSPNSPRVCFSPEGNSMLNHPLHDGDSMFYRESTEDSNDGFQYCNFEISDQSRQALEGAEDPSHRRQQTPSAHSRISFATPSKSVGTNLFEEGLMENDLVAISALNSLSSSPALAPPKMPVDDENDDDEDDSAAADGPKYPSNIKRQRDVSSKSFFAKVLGGIQDKQKESKKKRRLEF